MKEQEQKACTYPGCTEPSFIKIRGMQSGKLVGRYCRGHYWLMSNHFAHEREAKHFSHPTN